MGRKLTARSRAIKKLVWAWPESGVSQKAYCEREGIALYTFKYWRQKQLRASGGSKSSPSKAANFVPLMLQSDQPGPTPVGPCLELEYPNGVKLHVSGAAEDIALLQQLIKAW